jgi:hypothetical protein
MLYSFRILTKLIKQTYYIFAEICIIPETAELFSLGILRNCTIGYSVYLLNCAKPGWLYCRETTFFYLKKKDIP